MPAPSVGLIAQVLTLPSCTLDSPCSSVAAKDLLVGGITPKPIALRSSEPFCVPLSWAEICTVLPSALTVLNW